MARLPLNIGLNPYAQQRRQILGERLLGANSGVDPSARSYVEPRVGITATNVGGGTETYGDIPFRVPYAKQTAPTVPMGLGGIQGLRQRQEQPTPPQTPQSSMLAKIRSGLGASPTSPMGMALDSAAQSLLQQSGYSPVPRTTGQIFGEALGAAREGYMGGVALEQAEAEKALARRLADRDYDLELQKILSDKEKDKLGGSVRERAYNRVVNYDPEVATEAEQQQYAFDVNYLSEDKEIIDASGNTIRVRGLNLKAMGLPEPLGGWGDTPETTKTFKATEAQSKAVGFADRMNFANQQIDQLTSQGFEAPSLYDLTANRFGLTVGISPQARLYFTNARNFINAQLRQESGATINPSEFIDAYKTYFPQYGDDSATIETKRQNRLTVINSMKAVAGEAYEALDRPDIVLGSESYPFIYADKKSIEADLKVGRLKSSDWVAIDGKLYQVSEKGK